MIFDLDMWFTLTLSRSDSKVKTETFLKAGFSLPWTDFKSTQ